MATLPCTSTLTASGANLVSDAINVTVNPNPGITVFGFPATVGAGLQTSGHTVRLGEANHGGVTLTITSDNPNVRVSSGSTTAGGESVTIPVANGFTDGTFYVQALEGASGTATLTASAPQFTSGTATVTIVAPVITVGKGGSRHHVDVRTADDRLGRGWLDACGDADGGDYNDSPARRSKARPIGATDHRSPPW